MRARLLLPLLWLPLAVLATSGVVGPSRARADEAPPAVPPRGPPPAPASGATAEPAAVARLTPEELEILRRRFPDWDQRDVGERERIASNVLKLRQLSPEDRRRLLERAKKLELAGPDAVNALGQKLRAWHGMSHADHEQMREKRIYYRGMGAQVVGGLPPEARQLVTPGALPTSLTFPERLRLEVGIASLVRRKAVQAFVASPPLDAEPSPGAHPSQAQRLTAARDALRARGAAATDEDRRRFAGVLFEDRLLALRRRLQGETLDEPGRGARFGALAKEAFPDAFAAVIDDVARRAAKGREGLQPLLAEGAEAERGGSPAQRPLVELVILLERARPVFASFFPDLVPKAQAFQGELLLALGWKPEAVRQLAETTTEPERWLKLAAFRRWMSSGTGVGPWGGAGSWGGQGRRGAGGGGGAGSPHGPGGPVPGGGRRSGGGPDGKPPRPPEPPSSPPAPPEGPPPPDAGTPPAR